MSEQSLGAAVIWQTLDDLWREQQKQLLWQTKKQRLISDSTISECLNFLQCKTEIARHWFAQAQCRPFTPAIILKCMSKWGKYRGHGSWKEKSDV